MKPLEDEGKQNKSEEEGIKSLKKPEKMWRHHLQHHRAGGETQIALPESPLGLRGQAPPQAEGTWLDPCECGWLVSAESQARHSRPVSAGGAGSQRRQDHHRSLQPASGYQAIALNGNRGKSSWGVRYDLSPYPSRHKILLPTEFLQKAHLKDTVQSFLIQDTRAI